MVCRLSSIPGGSDKPTNKLGTILYVTAVIGAVSAVGFIMWKNLGRPILSGVTTAGSTGGVGGGVVLPVVNVASGWFGGGK